MQTKAARLIGSIFSVLRRQWKLRLPWRLENQPRRDNFRVVGCGEYSDRFNRGMAVSLYDIRARMPDSPILPRSNALTLALMTPFGGPPDLPFATDGKEPAPPATPTIHEALAALPRPRKHYQWYYATRPANAQIMHCRQGVHNFLRAYYHHKSADWKGNKPHRLAGWTAEELAKMPTYYIMDLFDDMPAAVGKEMPSAAEIAANQWLTEAELAVYAGEWQRTGFQGGLNWYRSRTSGTFEGELQLFAGRTIDVPSIFIGGTSDWGIYQTPGAFERTQEVCTRMVSCQLLDGAGHWVQQEQAEQVIPLLLDFLSHQAAA